MGKSWTTKPIIERWTGKYKGKRVEYSNGRVVEHRPQFNRWTGNFEGVKSTEVSKGNKKCFKCNSSVSPDSDGKYSCCGRTFY
jgi:hypothetical protein